MNALFKILTVPLVLLGALCLTVLIWGAVNHAGHDFHGHLHPERFVISARAPFATVTLSAAEAPLRLVVADAPIEPDGPYRLSAAVVHVEADPKFNAETEYGPQSEVTLGQTIVVPARGDVRLLLRFVGRGDPPPGQVRLVSSEGHGLALSIPIRNEAAVIALSSETVAFGQVALGRVVERTIQVTNRGNVPLELYDVEVDDPAFEFPQSLYDLDGDGEPGLEPGGQFTLKIRLRATREAQLRAQLIIGSNDPGLPNAEVALSATVVGTHH